METRTPKQPGWLFSLVGRRFLKPVRILSAVFAACIGGTLHAQLDLEGSVPANWNASGGALSISPHHYKMGVESLRWDWNGGSMITIADPGITAADVTDYFKNTCDFWVWNGTAVPGGKLRVEFMNGATAQYWFDFYLDFTGWRRAVRSYTNDMSKKSGPSATFTSVRITAPTTGSGSLYLDAVTWVGDRFTRIRDAQNPDIAGTSSNTTLATAYALPLDPLVPPTPTASELSELNTIRSRWLTATKGTSTPSASSVTSAGNSFTAMGIVEDANGIRGQPVVPNSASLESWPLTLARDYAWGTSGTATASRDRMLQLARHLMDQGHAANSNSVPTEGPGPDGYNYRGLPNALILMAPAYDTATKAEMWEFFRWAYLLGHFWTDNWERNTDYVYLQSLQELGAILFLTPSDAEAVRQLKGYKRYMERFWQFSEGSEDGIKVDGTGFHHRSHYDRYMYAYKPPITTFHYMRGTSFQIDQPTYENIRLATFAQMRISADGSGTSVGYFGNSHVGRSPFDTDLKSVDQVSLQQLGELGGTFYGQSADSTIARAYNRRFGVGSYALFTPYGVEDPPDGFLQYNYSPLGIYRRANWVASIRAPQRYLWSSEIFPEENRYGRYQAYGALEILYYGGRTASGQQLNGWDWNHTPGSTTIVLPDSKLLAENGREDVRSQINFAGALAFHDGQSGPYAGNFQEMNVGPNHNPTFVWRKSWFAFGSQVVCLGSDIANNDAANPTATTLLQGALANPSTALTLNGSAINAFPHNSTVSGATANWLLDPFGTGYLVQPGDNLEISLGAQTSAHHDGVSAPTTGNFAKVWLDHGTAPSGARYEYAVFPNTTAAAMATTAATHADPATKPYQVIQHDSTAHVVKWMESGQIGYSIFSNAALPPATQNAGLLMSVQRPCLVMTQLGTSSDAWISVVDPDLNFSNAQAAYGLPDASVARTLDFTVHGSWTLDNPDAGTSIVSSDGTTTILRVTTQHGLAEHLHLIATPGNAAWANLGSDWNDPVNWGANWGGQPPADDPAVDIAAFGTATVQPVLDNAYAAKGITMDGGTTLSGSGNLTLGAGGIVATGGGNLVTLANLTLATGQPWNVDAGDLTVSSAIAGAFGIGKTGGGLLTLAGTNTFTGGITLDSGSLILTGNHSAATGGILLRGAGDSGSKFNQSATTATFGGGSVVGVAAGKSIQVGGTNYDGTASQTLNADGTVNNDGSLLIARTGNLNLGGTWTQNGSARVLSLGGRVPTVKITTGGTLAYASTSDFLLGSSVTANAVTQLKLEGGTFITAARIHNDQTSAPAGASSRLVFSNGGILRLSANIADLFTTAGGGRGIDLGTGGGVIDTNGFATTVTPDITGPGGLSKTGPGTLTLAGSNNHSGGTAIDAGTLLLGSANAAGSSGTISMNGGTLRFSAENTNDLSSRLRIEDGKTAGFDTGGQDIVFATPLATGALATGGLEKSGSGTLTLDGANSFTGPTTLNEGGLRVGAASGASTTATLLSSSGITNHGTLIFRRTNASDVDLAGAISGSGAVIYEGSGVSGESRYQANNANTYIGGTTIGNCRVVLSHASGLGTGPVVITAGGQIFNNASGLTFTNPLTIAGKGWTESSGHLGALRIANNSTVAGPITLAANARICASNSATFSGGINGPFALELGEDTATGTVVLAGANTHGGDTILNYGALELAPTGSLRFAPSANGVCNRVTGSGTATFKGAFVIDTSAAAISNGNAWPLVSAASLNETFSASFNIPGYTENSGIWTRLDGLRLWTFSEATGVFSLSLLTNTEAWRFQHFGTTANTGSAADTFDANHDGETNLLEFATGQSPHAATLTRPALVKHGAMIEFTYTRANAALADGIAFTVEWSDHLSANSWSNAGVTEQILTDNGTVQTVKASVPSGVGGRRFLHLRVAR